MELSVYIRPLVIEDALTSYKWRNNPKLWRFTGARPDCFITPEIETAWLTEVLQRKNEKRFAICLRSDDTYIGNVFFTDITATDASIHIFIGEMKYWGERRAFEAIFLLGTFGFEQLQLQSIYALINKKNLASRTLAKVIGTRFVEETYSEEKNMDITKWIFTKKMYEDQVHFQSNNTLLQPKTKILVS